jgi:hypothetical protein
VYWQRVLRRPGALTALIAGAGGIVVTAGIAVDLLLRQRDITSCAAGYAVGPPFGLVFLAACLAAFAAGGLLSGAPGLTRPAPASAPGTGRGEVSTRVQALLVAVLLILTLLMVYETWSVSMLDDNPNPQYWPITYFVRCASRVGTLATLPVAAAMSAFFGKWLWYRPGRR